MEDHTVAVKDWREILDEYHTNPIVAEMLHDALFDTMDTPLSRQFELVLNPTKNRFAIGDIFKHLPTIDEGGKIFSRDEDLYNWFSGSSILGRDCLIRSWVYRFKKKVRYSDIVKLASTYRMYREYNLFDAVELAEMLVEKNLIEEKTSYYILLKERKEGVQCRLSIFKVRQKIHICVNQILLTGEWEEGTNIILG